MAPGTQIKPHQGWVTTVYRAHLGLVVPEDCALRVGDETRQWREGKTLVFDDTVTHKAWNYGSSDRVVLLFDFAQSWLRGHAAGRTAGLGGRLRTTRWMSETPQRTFTRPVYPAVPRTWPNAG